MSNVGYKASAEQSAPRGLLDFAVLATLNTMFSERRAIARTARAMKAQRLVAGTSGNVSARHARGLLITPTRRGYDTLRARDIALISLSGERLGRGSLEPSIEWPTHAAIYNARPDVGAIVHTHSPWATARSFNSDPLEVVTEERNYYSLDSVPVVPQQPSGSFDLARAVTSEALAADAMLLAGHGVIAFASSPVAALELCAVVEHLAQVDEILRRQPGASGGETSSSTSSSAV